MRRMSAILPPCWSTSSGSIPGQLDSHWIPLCRLVWRDVTNLFDERQTRYVVKLLMWLGCVTPKVGSASTFLPQSAALFLRTPVWHAPLQPNWNSLNKMNWKTIIINHNNYGTIILQSTDFHLRSGLTNPWVLECDGKCSMQDKKKEEEWGSEVRDGSIEIMNNA